MCTGPIKRSSLIPSITLFSSTILVLLVRDIKQVLIISATNVYSSPFLPQRIRELEDRIELQKRQLKEIEEKVKTCR